MISALKRGLSRLGRRIADARVTTKASAASAVFLLCLVSLGADSFFAMLKVRSSAEDLSTSTLQKQSAALQIANTAINIHVNIFRYVAWAATGVNPNTLNSLKNEIDQDLRLAGKFIQALQRRADLNPEESNAVRNSVAKWNRYATAVADTIDISTTDPALGTTMLGGTDEDYVRLGRDLETLVDAANAHTHQAADGLIAQATHSIWFIVFGGIASIVLGCVVTYVVARLLVRPIQDITRTMQGLAAGQPQPAAFVHAERGDEIGAMAGAISAFGEKLTGDNTLLAEREQELMAQRRELVEQNFRFDAALRNMSQGLAMYDRDGRLIVCNGHYAELYRLPPHLTKVGTTLRELLEARVAAGLYPGVNAAEYISDTLAHAAVRTDSDRLIELNGRVIAICHRPMPDGGWVSTHEDVTERRETQQRMIHMARHDALTELPNRLHFQERMEQALAQVRRDGSLAVLCIDLDHFKEVNDTLGHPVGDELLRRVSERLRSCIRETDTIARLGGDEFAVIQAPLHKAEDAISLATRLIETLSEPYVIDGHEVVIGTSVGLSFAPNDGIQAHDLLRNADMALYRAKADGRGMFRCFSPEMDKRLHARRKLEIDLRRALAEGEFELHYQPMISLEANRVIGFEALLRWKSPERGLVAPNAFIPLAEEIGLINGIGEWVLRQACRDATGWPDHIRVAVNLSAVQFRNRNLVSGILNALAESSLPPARLELEVTESVLLQHTDATQQMLRQLHDAGVRISMDDFGTGYSSLSYLHSFPFDKIKIDRSFIRELGTRVECAAIVRAVAGLGASLGIVTIAEGVETHEQLAQLRAAGCTEVQGFLFGKPRPLAELSLAVEMSEKSMAA